jgi:2-polyprenyl-3-methyl-5-hydroxy-6-metoxy-1,4-benzoquinol methylase
MPTSLKLSLRLSSNIFKLIVVLVFLKPAVLNPEEQWKVESEFADVRANYGDLDPLAIHRYKTYRRRWFPQEYRFIVLGDLRRKKILDVGCGDGMHSALLWELGAAEVTGIDISPRCIEACRQRADRNRMRAVYYCAPLERTQFAPASFDVIYCNAILHHMLSNLPEIAARMRYWLKPGGIWMAAEPINLCEPLRRLRLALPIPLEATPHERPLNKSDLAVIRSSFPTLQMRTFGLTTRFTSRLLFNRNYERSPVATRAIFATSSICDYLVLTFMPRIAGTAIMWARVE